MRILLKTIALTMLVTNGCAAVGDRSAAESRRPVEPVLWRQEFTRPVMGTLARIVIHYGESTAAEEAAAAAFARMEHLDRVLSDYKKDSEVNVLCQRAGTGPVRVSDDLLEILRRSIEFSHASGGAFDVTVGPLVRLWREARRRGAWPKPDEVEVARHRVGWRKITLDEARQTVRLKRAGMQLDFGGIGKGFAADEAMKVLREHGCPIALVEIGGDMTLGDPPPGRRGWAVQIRFAADADNRGNHDDNQSPEPRTLLLSNCGVATSGDVEQHMIIDGERYSHIIDPRTGYSLKNSPGVCIITPDGTTADALASAISVLGETDGLKLAERFEGTRVFVEERDGE